MAETKIRVTCKLGLGIIVIIYILVSLIVDGLSFLYHSHKSDPDLGLGISTLNTGQQCKM